MGTLFDYINWIAVSLGALGYFMLGALWYAPLFGKKWIAYNKIDITNPDAKKAVGPMMFGSFVLQFLQCLAIAIIVSRMFDEIDTNWMTGIKLGAITGGCFCAAAIGVNYLYEKKPFGLFLINGGYTVLGHIIAAVIICSWR